MIYIINFKGLQLFEKSHLLRIIFFYLLVEQGNLNKKLAIQQTEEIEKSSMKSFLDVGIHGDYQYLIEILSCTLKNMYTEASEHLA